MTKNNDISPFNFSSYLTSNMDINEEMTASVLKNCQTKHFKKGTFPVHAGDICRSTFFVEKGLLRQYSIDEKGKEHILSFAPEGWFVGDRGSQYFNRPSTFFIEALEDTDVALLNDELFLLLGKEIPGFSCFNTDLLHNHILALQNRIDSLLSATAEERYLNFIKMYPDIILRVPQSMVASYLGITPESLSRVRKGLAKKNFK